MYQRINIRIIQSLVYIFLNTLLFCGYRFNKFLLVTGLINKEVFVYERQIICGMKNIRKFISSETRHTNGFHDHSTSDILHYTC